MLEKVMIFYSFIVILNSAIEFNVGADSNESNSFLNKDSITTVAATSGMWQPIIQSHYWLPTPTAHAPAPAPTAATESLYMTHIKNNHAQKAKEDTGNYDKQFLKPLKAKEKLVTQPYLPKPAYMTSESYFYPINQQNNNNRTNTITNTKESEKLQFNSYRHNTAKKQYAQRQISKNVIHHQQEYPKHLPLPHQVMNESSSILSNFTNSNYLMDMDMAKQKELANPNSSLLSDWHYTVPVQQIATTNTSHNMENILPTTLDSFLTNEYLIDGIKRHLQQEQLYISETNNDIKSSKIVDKEAVKVAKSSTADRRSASGEQLSEQIVNNEEFGDRIRHTISSNTTDISDSNGNDGKQSDVIVNEADAIYHDIDREILNSMAQNLVEITSTGLSAATAALTKRLQSFDMKNIFSAAISIFLQNANETENETSAAEFKSIATSGTGLIRQLGKNEIPSSVDISTAPHTFSLSTAPTSKSSTLISSGRKLKKKVKKKFQQFLLPLLLAYKLKFLALIPFLAGGLILLVGSTGLAGFFFALFTAVMSLKIDHDSAIIVKNY